MSHVVESGHTLFAHEGKKVQNDINLVETTAQNDKPIFRVILMIKQRMNHIKQRVSCSSAAPALLCELV